MTQTARTAIITGASSGIGLSLARLLAGKGYHLGLMARRENLLRQLKDEITKAHPQIHVHTHKTDLVDYDGCRLAVNALSQQLGGMDLFIANAGIGGPTPAWKRNWPVIRQMMEVNALGAIASIEAAKEIMLERKGGHLVGISSPAGMRGLPETSAYCASKAALSTYLESLRLDLRCHHIKVSIISPGFIATPMTAKNKFTMPFLMPCEMAAKKIYSAIERGRKSYLFPWQLYFLMQLTRLIPDPVYDGLMALRGRRGVFRLE